MMVSSQEKKRGTQQENRLMEEKKKKKQEEKKKKESAQKKAAENKTKVPESAKARAGAPTPGDPPANSTPGSSSDGKRPPSGAPHPPRELPPRFRHHEPKQLLRRGQPLPAGSPPPGSPQAFSTNQHAEPSHHIGLAAKYENLQGRAPSNSSSDPVIVDRSDTEAWPCVSRSDDHTHTLCTTDSDCAAETSSGGSMSTATDTGQLGRYAAPHPTNGGASQAQPCWGSATLNLNFNLNLNPNSNPSAWPVLGQEESGTREAGLGSRNAPPPGLCGSSGAPATQGGSGGHSGNKASSCANFMGCGGSSAWGDPESRSSPPTTAAFSSEPQNLNADGPNGTKRESSNPVCPLSEPNSFVPPPQSPLQVTGEDGSGDSAWDSAPTGWGSGGGGAGGACVWGQGNGGESGIGSLRDHADSWGHRVSAPASEGSSDSQESPSQRRERPPAEEASPKLLTQDLDPRVLCNTGWGQTPVRQHTAWDTEDTSGTQTWGSPSPATPTSTVPKPANVRRSDGAGHSATTAPTWGSSGPPPNQLSSTWGESSGKKVANGPTEWGSVSDGPSTGAPAQSWTPEEKSPSWDDHQAKPDNTSQSWSEGPTPTPSRGWGGAGGGGVKATGEEWARSEEGKNDGPARPHWEDTPRGWGRNAQGHGGGWEDTPRASGPRQGWGGPSQEGASGSSGTGGGAASWGGAASVRQSSTDWGGELATGGNGGCGGAGGRQEPTGWEDPSPPSLRRRMEIDDGTSAWGDPNAYSKTVNLWDKNAACAPTSGRPSAPGSRNGNKQPCHAPPRHSQPHGPCGNSGSLSDPSGPQQHGPPSRTSLAPDGWGEAPGTHPKAEPSWGQGPCPPPTVDNGTSAWGKPLASCRGWGDGPEAPGPFGRGTTAPGSAPCKSAPKSMQEGWVGGSEDPNPTGGPWEAEDGEGWSSTTSQESNSSCNSWANLPRQGPQKGKVMNKKDDSWIMNRLIKQLTDMGFPRDPAEEALRNSNMNLDQAMSALLERKTELDKRGVGGSDYNNGPVHKTAGCRPGAQSKEPASERPAFLDKMQSGMIGGGGASLGRAIQQAPPPPQSVPPLNSSQPGLRAQVPQFLSPQVQAQLLQFAAKNTGLNPALLSSPINPQHMTLLNQLYQLQLAYQRLQIQQQMLQAQRNVSGPIRQQEQQVARTINNMQQQIQQQQRQLAQALLMKQQLHAPSHPGTGKSTLDSFPGHHQASGLTDLQTKEQQPSPSTYIPYPLSGLNSNVNVSSMEAGNLSAKDPPQPQSRLAQWTHPSPMESLSPLETGLSKHGRKLSHAQGQPPMDDAYSPYNLLPSTDLPSGSLVSPESWGQTQGPGDKLSNGTNISWPPEFCPGVPWKGLQNIDPETDPNVTPGSVPSGPTINTTIQDVNRYLLRDRSGGKLSDKPTWPPGSTPHGQAPLSHELWKAPQGPRNTPAPSRPPPGLTNTKPSSAWGGGALSLAPGWGSSSYAAGTTWSSDSSVRGSSWLVLRNLTPQIDGSTLRTLCLQHGPLITFHLSLTQGSAVVRYSSKEEAAKAQKSLHMCVLGNTTILAEFAGEEEVNRFFAQGQSLTPPATSWQASQGNNQARPGLAGAGPGLTGAGPAHAASQWNGSQAKASAGGGNGSGNELLWGGAPTHYSSLWGAPGGEDAGLIGSPTPMNTLLPGDLLSGESM
ncbi:trinucleotide repeat-containing gene 6C protein-like isoform X3 [Scleropages formosus]|uniref:trinucleotide repeat-containing gene 6C protein-like isoform X3 n=2 Tax=Scleropages formosus TaxID=113540 RepID=UPI0010FA7D15|nr:trinucleotide repeat-containing gene 6C protein-like isoform X3 [Scleropages formosus]